MAAVAGVPAAAAEGALGLAAYPWWTHLAENAGVPVVAPPTVAAAWRATAAEGRFRCFLATSPGAVAALATGPAAVAALVND